MGEGSPGAFIGRVILRIFLRHCLISFIVYKCSLETCG
jgi:hypothetical protein